MKLAYFSPLNPQPTGISDYSEELLPYLAGQADIDLFVDGFRPTNQELLQAFLWFDYRQDPTALERLKEYDAVVYHMGNDHRYHAGIFDVMRTHPGVVVFHDFALQDFFLGLARERGDIRLYLDELAACHGEHQRARAREYFRLGGVPPQVTAPLSFPLNFRLAQTSEGIVVHSSWGREQFAQIARNVPVAQIPMTVPPPKLAPRLSAEAHEGRLNIASFGLITPGKGIEQTLRALFALRSEHDFHYSLVGADNSYFDVRALINSYRMTDRVTITGHVPLEEFERWILNTDIAVNLRERTVGETSASLCRIMAAGVPAIVSNVGTFAELPDDAVVKIDPDEIAEALLLAYLRRLLGDVALRRRIGANARRHMLTEHNIEESAARYVAFIREVIEGRTRRRLLNGVSDELSRLEVRANDDAFLRSVAAEVAVLVPAAEFTKTVVKTGSANSANGNQGPQSRSASIAAVNGQSAAIKLPSDSASPGRLSKIEGVDYKRAAVDYPRMLDAERSHYLRTKPFYNLANKPEKHLGDGMDAETHRHFTDFANMAVALALPAGARILDVGCGSGWLSEFFARLGYEVTGVDISDDLIRMARERVERVPYDVDHETPLRCRFLTQDVELEPLRETFDAVICYDSLHHFEDERAVFRHLANMLDVGGLLFILEGHKPSAGSATEDELQDVMRRYGTLESPFSTDYLRELISDNGCVVVGDYVSVNGLFEREMLEGDRLPLRTLDTDYHYLTCIKVVDGASATSVPDSQEPGLLRAEFTLSNSLPQRVEPGAKINVSMVIRNAGDTLWLSGQTLRAGVVMPGVRVIDERGEVISEVHGHPMLPRPVAPGQAVSMEIPCPVPSISGTYSVKIDLVDQHVCWFEERGSQPLMFSLEVVDKSR